MASINRMTKMSWPFCIANNTLYFIVFGNQAISFIAGEAAVPIFSTNFLSFNK